MKLKAYLASAAACAVLSAAAAAHASVNLVDNGGFETADFSDWIQFGNTGATGVGGVFAGVAPNEGSEQAHFGPVGSAGGIRQALNLTLGHVYQLKFDLANLGGPTNAFDVSVGSLTGLVTFNDAAPFAYTHFTRLFVANSSTMDLSFTFQQNPSYYLLDNVSVIHAGGPDVPEPATWALLIGGFALTGAAFRRQRALAA